MGNQIREGNRKLSESAPCRLTIFGHGADKRSVDLISDAMPFGRPRYGEPNAVSNAVIRVYDAAVIETHEHASAALIRYTFPAWCD